MQGFRALITVLSLTYLNYFRRGETLSLVDVDIEKQVKYFPLILLNNLKPSLVKFVLEKVSFIRSCIYVLAIDQRPLFPMGSDTKFN